LARLFIQNRKRTFPAFTLGWTLRRGPSGCLMSAGHGCKVQPKFFPIDLAFSIKRHNPPGQTRRPCGGRATRALRAVCDRTRSETVQVAFVLSRFLAGGPVPTRVPLTMGRA